MNPLYQIVLSVLIHHKRKCGHCGMEQVVPAGAKRETVTCKYCGKPIPPPKDTAR